MNYRCYYSKMVVCWEQIGSPYGSISIGAIGIV
jgi:hypothetical protein